MLSEEAVKAHSVCVCVCVYYGSQELLLTHSSMAELYPHAPLKLLLQMIHSLIKMKRLVTNTKVKESIPDTGEYCIF